jgi:hypothetical protein
MSSVDYIVILANQWGAEDLRITKIPDKKIKQAYLTDITEDTFVTDVTDSGITTVIEPDYNGWLSYAHNPDASIIVLYYALASTGEYVLRVSIDQQPVVDINPGPLADAIAANAVNLGSGADFVTRVMYAENKFYLLSGYDLEGLITLWTSSDGLEWSYQGVTNLEFAYD